VIDVLIHLRCHGGDLFYEFGNIVRSGKQFRDSADLPFSQLIVDYVSSFARSHNPNPDHDFLKTRGYSDTLSQLEHADGVWKAITSTTGPIQRLDWPSKQGTFTETSQCEALGIPLDFYL
jgi:hypothetical protein